MDVEDFAFDLPPDRIALRPADPRDAARMLVVEPDGALTDRGVGDLPAYLRPGDVVVFNDTKVIPARLFGCRGEARVEITLHKRERDDVWRAFVKNAKRLRAGDRVALGDGFEAEVLAKADGGEVTLCLHAAGGDVMAALHRHGAMPLPPYIAGRRPIEAGDAADYQTVFAACEGAVAAPTAGLHFTERLLAAIDASGAERVHVTLHVGAGTFLPVKVARTEDHVMHAEWGEVSAQAAERIRAARRVVAIGTTAARILETAAASGTVQPFTGDTAIFITPGYRFKAVDMLFTNFHLPRSTLFMLVAAFAGLDAMKAAYAHAIAAGYRFYSYGDATLLNRYEGAP